MPSPSPTGEQYAVSGGGYEAVVTELGAGLRVLRHDGVDLVEAYAENEMPTAGRGQLLLPWPNRIAGGRYRFAGRQHQLPLDEPATMNAIHGLVRWLPWTVDARGDDHVRLALTLHPRPGYPFLLACRVTYALSADGLRVDVTARNRSDEPAPYGTGSHPYLVAGHGPVDDWELRIPARTMLDVDNRGLPGRARPVTDTCGDFTTPRRIGDTVLDNPFTQLVRDDEGTARATVTGHAGEVELWLDEAYTWLQVFTGDTLPGGGRTAVAVEPMTCPPDAFNTGTDLVVLEPGEAHHATWGLRLR